MANDRNLDDRSGHQGDNDPSEGAFGYQRGKPILDNPSQGAFGHSREEEQAASSGGMSWSQGRTAHDLRVGNGSGKSHHGRGPKNYKRSDARIQEDVCDRLSDDHDLDASEITVSVSECEVTLAGEVDSKKAKRLAEDCADGCSGVSHVQNNLRVKKQGNASGT